MNFGSSKKGIKEYALKGIASLTGMAILLCTGCTLGGSNFTTVDKDIKTDYHAVIVASDNTDDNSNIKEPTNGGDDKDNQTDIADNGNNTDNQTDIPDNRNDNADNGNNEEKVLTPGGFLCMDNCGFEINNSKSFANRAQGVYKIVSDGRIEEYIEFYNLNDNLYAFYSGNGYGAMEFFTDDNEGFSSETANSMRVKILSFTALTNDAEYISDGKPAIMDMTFTEDGIEFTNYDKSSGDTLFAPAEVKLEKVTGEMGYLDGFAYMDDEYSAELLCEDLDIETTDIPEEILGSWILLGDVESGIVFEFTEDGYVQAYLKNKDTEVSFIRGTYTVGKEKVNGGTDIFMDVVYLGIGEGYPFNFCYKTEGECYVYPLSDEQYPETIS